MAAADWSLDPRLAEEAACRIDLPGVAVLLRDEARWPWVVAAPKHSGAREICDLDAAAGLELWSLARALAAWAAGEPGIDKVNVGALGNVVAQLHLHVVGRSIGDPAWPGPVWGFGRRTAMDKDLRQRRLASLTAALEAWQHA